MKKQQRGVQTGRDMGDWRKILTSEVLVEPESVKRHRIINEIARAETVRMHYADQMDR